MHRRRGAALSLALVSCYRPASQQLICGSGTCRFPASSATAFRFDRSRDAVVSIPPYAARATIANNPATPATARVFMTDLHHAGQRELLSYLSKRGIELGPDLVFLGTAKVAGVAAFCDFGGRSFWLMMIEIEVAPAARSGKALGILDRHVGVVETPGEIAPPRRLRARTIGVLARQRELQLLEQDRPFGEFIRLLEYLV